MKKILLCVLVLLMVAAMVSALEIVNTRPLKRAVQPYVEAWGPYYGYHIASDEVQGTAAGFIWLDGFGQTAHYVIFAYWDGEWVLYEASGELLKTPANIG